MGSFVFHNKEKAVNKTFYKIMSAFTVMILALGSVNMTGA